MKKLQHFALAFGVALTASAVCAPVFAQSSSLDFGRGNSITVGNNGTTFGFNGNTVQTGNYGGSIRGSGGSFSWGNGGQSSSMGRTYDLDPAYPSHGMRYVAPPPGAFGPGAGGNEWESSGAQGVVGRGSRRESGFLARRAEGKHDYEDYTQQQTPMSGGGLPETHVRVESLGGRYQFGETTIPSGQFRYGFSNTGRAMMISPTGLMNQGINGMQFLPQTSTGSLDINTVDR